MHQLGIQNIRRLQVSKSSCVLSICHELCLYVIAINLCTGTSLIVQWYEVNIPVSEYCAIVSEIESDFSPTSSRWYTRSF